MSRDGARTRKCPRRSRDSSPRNIHVAAAAAPLPALILRPRRRYGRESGRRPQARSSTRSGAFPASPSPTSRTRLPTRPTTPKGSSRRRSSFYWCWRFRSRSWSARASTRARGTRAASRASARVALSANRGRRRRRRWPFEPSRGRRRIANLGSEFLTRVCCAFKLCVYSGDAVAAPGSSALSQSALLRRPPRSPAPRARRAQKTAVAIRVTDARASSRDLPLRKTDERRASVAHNSAKAVHHSLTTSSAQRPV